MWLPLHSVDCRNYIATTGNSCYLSGNGEIVVTRSNDSGMGIVVFERQVFGLYVALDFGG